MKLLCSRQAGASVAQWRSRSSAGGYSTIVSTNQPECVEDKVYYQCKDDNEYQMLKRQLQFSEFQMFTFLRNKLLVNDYFQQGAQFVHSRMHQYASSMDWYDRYIIHYKCSKLMWVINKFIDQFLLTLVNIC